MGKNNNKHNGVGLAAGQPGLPRPPGPGDLANSLWEETPGLSWVMSLGDGQLQVRATHPSANVTTAPIAALGRMLRARIQEQGPGVVQFLGELPALDGTPHHFLIIGFPIGGSNGTQHRHLAGVAINVTQHKLRVDQLARQALVDELTCVYNLRGFHLFADHEIKVARRRKTLCAIIYVDVDGLKAVNDARGHADGDAILVATATLLRKVYRECDVIGRLGGDEFAVFASDVSGDPEHLAERLRAEAQGGAVSIGIACLAPSDRMPLADLIAAADRAMYRDKASKALRAALAAEADAFTGTGFPDTST